ncbi:MAG: aminotransferase class I/II-fold pyridoxal phosphate-dependent enzyme [Lautropia sp.]|nr:aminotransferase class I/II-fold pyridoxal phosphate-dependent enzyme [Lautropia sp.]
MILPDSVAHGGPDAQGSVPHDFSTNANAAGPCPFVQERLRALAADRYPDPACTDLIARLAEWHQVSPERVIVGASASELIMRLTAAMVRLHGPHVQVRVPPHAYGDYARAAGAWGLPVSTWGREMPPHFAANKADSPGAAQESDHLPGDDRSLRLPVGRLAILTWICDPDSPFGQSPRHDSYLPDSTGDLQAGASQYHDAEMACGEHHRTPAAVEGMAGNGRSASRMDSTETVPVAAQVLDRVYAPLQLEGRQPDPAWLDRVWQLHSPNKALGLCGVRGGYLIAPQALTEPEEALCATLRALSPSWPLGAHAVALLDAWTHTETRQWLSEALMQLREWKQMQVGGLRQRGWRVHESLTSFFCAEPPWLVSALSAREGTGAHVANGTAKAFATPEFRSDQDKSRSIRLQQHLRAQGIKLRETTSFGLPGAFRLCVHHPRSQEALWHALDNFHD